MLYNPKLQGPLIYIGMSLLIVLLSKSFILYAQESISNQVENENSDTREIRLLDVIESTPSNPVSTESTDTDTSDVNVNIIPPDIDSFNLIEEDPINEGLSESAGTDNILGPYIIDDIDITTNATSELFSETRTYYNQLLSLNAIDPDEVNYSKKVNLLDLYESALIYNIDVRQARIKLEQAMESYTQARSSFLPNLNLSGEAGNGSGSEVDSYTYSNGILSLSQNILDINSWKDFDLADFEIERAKLDLLKLSNNLIRDIVSMWLESIDLKSQLISLRGQIDTLNNEFLKARTELSIGSNSNITFYRIQGDLNNRRYLLNEAEARLRTRLNEMFLLTNVRISIDQVPFNIRPQLLRLANTEDDWETKALENNLDIKIYEISKEMAQVSYDKERAGHYPTVDLFAQYGTYNDESRLAQNYDTTRYGIRVNIPLFSGLNTSSRVKEQKLEVDAQDMNLMHQKQVVITDTDNFVSNIQVSIDAIESLRLYEASQVLNLKAVQKRFDLDQSSVTDYLDSYTDWFDAHTSLSEAVYRHINGELSLKALANDISVKDLEIIQRSIESTSSYGW